VPAIVEILEIYHMGTFGQAEREELPPLGHFFVACDGDRVVGCAAFLLFGQSKLTAGATDAETASLAVHPDYRGTRLGAALHTARLERMADLGVETVYTEADTPAIVDWYVRKFGCVILRSRPKYHEFGDPDVDTYTLLKLDLSGWIEARRIRRPVVRRRPGAFAARPDDEPL